MKRICDFCLALILHILCSPLMIFIALLVRITLGSPVIFAQQRSGIYGKIFTLKKFRTMKDQRDSEGQLLSDEQRLTPFGKFLRKTSLDELPQLWNIIRGEMSFVGPRPLLIEYLPLYNLEQARRMEVRPGITGWAQINGRNTISWEEKFKLDVWYVENQSFYLDMKILFLTFLKVLQGNDINQRDCATMSAFKGTLKEDKKLLIVGAGGLGREVLEFCLDVNKDQRYIVLGFLDDNLDALDDHLGLKIIEKIQDYKPKKDEFLLLAIGNPLLRKSIFEDLKLKGAEFMTFIHPTAYVSPTANIAEGVILAPYASVSANAKVRRGAFLNFYANVGHDAILGDFSVMNVHSNINGLSELEECVFLGGHAVVLPGVKISARAKIGAGSVAMRRVKADMTVVGVPAQKFL